MCGKLMRSSITHERLHMYRFVCKSVGSGLGTGFFSSSYEEFVRGKQE